MLNKAAVPCVRCGETVEIGDGHFVKIAGKGWKVEHGSCPVIKRTYDALNAAALAMLNSLTKRETGK